nr:thiol reductant ABC exporter subunit CydC [Gordonia soli]
MRDDPLLRALGFLGLAPWPVIRALLLGVAGALSALGLAALSAWLITRAWQMPPVLFLSVAITAVRALGISRGVFRYLERLATHDLALGAMATARERVYRTLAGGSAGYSVSLRRGDLLTRTGDDIDEIGNALIRGVIPIGVGAVTGIAAVVVMAFVAPSAAVVLAVALIVSSVVAPWMAARGSARSIADGAVATTASVQATSSLLWHAPELAVAGRRDDLLSAVSRADREAVAAADRGVRWQAAASAATPLALGASLLAACLIAIDLAGAVPGSLAAIASGTGLTPMVIGVLILLPLSAFESTAPLTEAGVQIERSRQSARRVMALVDGAGAATRSEPPGDVLPLAGPVTLELTDLSWGWPRGGAPVHLGPAGGLSRQLAAGSRLVITGPSGSGKSTLALTMAGLLTPVSGTVRCRDADGVDAPTRRTVGYFAEEGHVFATTVAENLKVARGDATVAELERALETVGLASWVAGLPEGLDTDLAGAEALSGGQRRRLLVARALLYPAAVIILDEPTEHLDADDAGSVLDALLDPGSGWFRPDQTVVVITHQLDSADDTARDVDVLTVTPTVVSASTGIRSGGGPRTRNGIGGVPDGRATRSGLIGDDSGTGGGAVPSMPDEPADDEHDAGEDPRPRRDVESQRRVR